MKKPITLLFSSTLLANAVVAQTICDTQGNVAIFTNYDGGKLSINVDQNISDLKIGVVAYNAVEVDITGPFAGNITEVRYAGINLDAGAYCGGDSIPTTVVSGVTPGIVTVLVAPAGTITNQYGYPDIICGYSCDLTTWQGGCNTADEVEDYFLTNFNGTLWGHWIQYDCWEDPWNISSGGVCCATTTSLGLADGADRPSVSVHPSVASTFVTVLGANNVVITDAAGRTVTAPATVGADRVLIDVTGLRTGTYFARARGFAAAMPFAVVR